MQEEKFNCTSCLATNPGDRNQVRAQWHCGFMPQENWVGDEPAVGRFGGEKVGANLCPGALVRLESVIEATKAHLWFKQSQLETAFPNPPKKVLEACEEAARAWNLWEAEQHQLAQQKV